MSNPNNCATCRHKAHPDGGWCYMFRREPVQKCTHWRAAAHYTEPMKEDLVRRIVHEELVRLNLIVERSRWD